MNKNQRIVLVCGVLLTIITILFPPWLRTIETERVYSQQSAGYRSMGSPPKPDFPAMGHTIDTTRLIIQLFGIFLMTGFGIYFLKTPPPKPPTAKPQNASERQQYPTRTTHSQKR